MSAPPLMRALPSEDVEVYVLAMLTPSDSIDLFLGDLERRSRSKTGRTEKSYRDILDKFVDSLGREDIDVSELVSDDYRRFLNRYTRNSIGYQATIYATLNSHAKWLAQQGRIKRNPLDTVPRPRRLAPEDLDVTTVSTADVPRLLAAADGDAERITIAVLAYMGPRRNAAALLRLRDYDRYQGTLRFQEKGTKTINKPVPDELADILDGAISRGVYGDPVDPDAYLIPSEGPLARNGERDDRVIWRLVKKVGRAAGVQVHSHALRAAFATFYLERNPNDLVGLKELMGHKSIQTTMVYLRKLDKGRAMEPVRSLSWAAVAADNAASSRFPQRASKRFGDSSVVGAGGFEPPSGDSPLVDRAGTERGDSAA